MTSLGEFDASVVAAHLRVCAGTGSDCRSLLVAQLARGFYTHWVDLVMYGSEFGNPLVERSILSAALSTPGAPTA